jgi:hypothetical protein
MSDKPKNGGPVFPQPLSDLAGSSFFQELRAPRGMTMLEYYAAAALNMVVSTEPEAIAKAAFDIAAAMVAEQERRK